MNDVAAPVGEENITAGRLLREAREAAGMHVASLAVSLKVPVRKLEALEEDRYDELPDAVFVRALASSVCRTLKIDPHPVLDRLPQTSAPRLLQQTDGINAPFRPAGEARTTHVTEHVSKPVVVTVFALLLGALVLIFLPRGNDAPTTRAGTAAPAAAPAASVAVASQPTPPTAVVAEPGSVPAAAAPASAAPAATPVAAVQPVPAGVAPVASASAAGAAQPAASAVAAASAAAPAALVASAAAGAASGTVVFRTRAPSWISVTDAKGTTVLKRLVQAGETVGVSGTPPLAVTVGSVQATEVQVRGQPFDLAPLSRDNVARFQVN